MAQVEWLQFYGFGELLYVLYGLCDCCQFWFYFVIFFILPELALELLPDACSQRVEAYFDVVPHPIHGLLAAFEVLQVDCIETLRFLLPLHFVVSQVEHYRGLVAVLQQLLLDLEGAGGGRAFAAEVLLVLALALEAVAVGVVLVVLCAFEGGLAGVEVDFEWGWGWAEWLVLGTGLAEK